MKDALRASFLCLIYHITKNKKVREAVMKFCQARLSPPLVGQIIAEASLTTPQEYMDQVYEEYLQARDSIRRRGQAVTRSVWLTFSTRRTWARRLWCWRRLWMSTDAADLGMLTVIAIFTS